MKKVYKGILFTGFLSLHQHTKVISITMAVTFSDIFKVIFAVILPPLGVLLEVGVGWPLVINIGLTILGYVPGIIHALYIILKY